jgi:hypothetical protein
MGEGMVWMITCDITDEAGTFFEKLGLGFETILASIFSGSESS